jgi:hypothetical protein
MNEIRRTDQTLTSSTSMDTVIITESYHCRFWERVSPSESRDRFINAHNAYYFLIHVYSIDEEVKSMMIIIFWEMTPGGSYKNRRFGGSYRLHLQGARVQAGYIAKL